MKKLMENLEKVLATFDLTESEANGLSIRLINIAKSYVNKLYPQAITCAGYGFTKKFFDSDSRRGLISVRQYIGKHKNKMLFRLEHAAGLFYVVDTDMHDMDCGEITESDEKLIELYHTDIPGNAAHFVAKTWWRRLGRKLKAGAKWIAFDEENLPVQAVGELSPEALFDDRLMLRYHEVRKAMVLFDTNPQKKIQIEAIALFGDNILRIGNVDIGFIFTGDGWNE